MKKIIAAFDGLKYSKSTRDYALYIAGQTKAHLVGVFLDDPTYTSYKIYELISDSETSEQKLEYSLHHDRKVAISDLKHETIYADLLIINSSETLTHYVEKPPTRFIREILEDAQCPVLLVPPKFKKAEKIKLLYDGAPSSVHAIKMFSYMLPQLKTLDTEVISVKPYGQTLHLPDTKLMKEFMKRHFPKATYTVLKGFPEVEIMKYLRETGENSFVVLGAYRRGFISRWFHESMADTIMKDLKLPLFIAHSK
jgi:nucleotide-binding universal stress UspA family protein